MGYSLTSNNELLLELESKRTFGDLAFCVAAWNSLPSKIRNSRALNNFKHTFKTHLIRPAAYTYDVTGINLYISLYPSRILPSHPLS